MLEVNLQHGHKIAVPIRKDIHHTKKQNMGD
jgi:hypothetical protein